MSSAGLFIKRTVSAGYYQNAKRIEVVHAAYNETGVSWFWGATGSGVFIDLAPLRAHGRVVQVSE